MSRTPVDVKRNREWLDASAMLGAGTSLTDARGRATVLVTVRDADEQETSALVRLHREPYYGYALVSLQEGARTRFGEMEVEVVSVGPRVVRPETARISDSKSLKWKGDHGYSK